MRQILEIYTWKFVEIMIGNDSWLNKKRKATSKITTRLRANGTIVFKPSSALLIGPFPVSHGLKS